MFIFVIDYLKGGHRGHVLPDIGEGEQAMYLYPTNSMQHVLKCQERQSGGTECKKPFGAAGGIDSAPPDPSWLGKGLAAPP